jgi:hypothetical protein
MTDKSLLASEIDPPPPDDLEEITGIGPASSRRLSAAGFDTYAKVGAASHADLWKIVKGTIPGLSFESFIEQDWPGEARRLDREIAFSKPDKDKAFSVSRQRYETFKVDLRLAADESVRSTEVVHVQNGSKDSWAGWDVDRMARFIAQHAAFRLPAPEPTLAQEPIAPGPQHVPRLEIVKVISGERNGVVQANTICVEQDWRIHVEWLLSDVQVGMLAGDWLFQAHLECAGRGENYSLPKGGPGRIAVASYANKEETTGTYRYAADIDVDAGSASAGIYRCVVVVRLEKPDGTSGGLVDFDEGVVLHLYSQRLPIAVA